MLSVTVRLIGASFMVKRDILELFLDLRGIMFCFILSLRLGHINRQLTLRFTLFPPHTPFPEMHEVQVPRKTEFPVVVRRCCMMSPAPLCNLLKSQFKPDVFLRMVACLCGRRFGSYS